MEKERLKELVNKYDTGSITLQEREELLAFYDSLDFGELVDVNDPALQERAEGQYQKLISRAVATRRYATVRRLWYRWAVAAMLLLAIGVSRRLWQQKHKMQPALVQAIVPGHEGAILTLANGSQVLLDSTTGIIAQQGHIRTVNTTGQLTYTADTAAAAGPMVYNTLATPRARQYRLTLPDGTRVWLNASSSIRYPIAFTGKERRVTITGEVYMEVAKDAEHPFIVTTRHSDIMVLGTHFNIMAYEDEPAVNTTLLEGSVKISIPGKQIATIIKPGEQASVGNQGDDIKVKHVNAANIAAWINGFLSLKDCSVQEFMNQLSRWYDVDIEYAGKAPQQRFGGLINRNTPLSDILSVLDTGGIHTRLEGKKIIVLSH